MKKAAIIFAIIFVLSLAIPMLSFVDKKENSNKTELVTIFSNLEGQCHLPSLNQK